MLSQQYLSALIYFERAATHQSFALAAEELHVTRSAVSHRISSLESILNVRLFTRTTRQVRLTRQGKDLFESTRQAFDLLRHGEARIARKGVLRISLGSYLSSHWLMGRLARFEAMHPNVRVLLQHQSGWPDPSSYDLAIVWTERNQAIGNSTVLFDRPVFAVAAPDAVSTRTCSQPFWESDLPAIHYQSRKSWRHWLHSNGISDHFAKTGEVFNDPNLVLEAAIHGRGVALGYLPFTRKYLDQGQLVKVSNLEAPAEKHYRLINQYPESGNCCKLENWLIAEASNKD